MKFVYEIYKIGFKLISTVIEESSDISRKVEILNNLESKSVNNINLMTARCCHFYTIVVDMVQNLCWLCISTTYEMVR